MRQRSEKYSIVAWLLLCYSSSDVAAGSSVPYSAPIGGESQRAKHQNKQHHQRQIQHHHDAIDNHAKYEITDLGDLRILEDVHDESIVPTRGEYESDDGMSDEGNTKSNSKPVDEVIVVVAVDGSLAGISKRTGDVIWNQKGLSPHRSASQRDAMKQNINNPKYGREKDSKQDSTNQMLEPLVTTSTTTKTASDSRKTAAVPSVDGRVYLTASDVTVVASVRDLVERSPFVDSRGMVYVGHQSSSAMAIDGDTGDILLVVSAKDPLPVDDKTLDGRNVVWVGRVDHSISVHDARSGSGDVQFSVAEVMSVADMVGESSTEPWEALLSSSDQNRKKYGSKNPSLLLPNKHPRGNPFQSPGIQSSTLVATPSGHVAYRNHESGRVEWVAKDTFHTPIVFAIESSSGLSLNVDIIQDAPNPNSSIEYMSREMEKQLELLGSEEHKDDQSIVRALSNGQLFAMPLGKSISTSPLSPLDISHQHTIASVSSTSNANAKAQPTIGRQNLKLNNDGKTIQTSQDRMVSGTKRACQPNMKSFPACLTRDAAEYSVGEEGNFLSESAPHQGEIINNHGMVIAKDSRSDAFYQYHPDFHIPSIEKTRRNKYYTAFKILGSWLAPLVALIFVTSFELGRRKRQNDKESNVLQVSDEVLGYGGQGTVVYKGVLDGRSVAVKRMLKAYHASADREISLLIESDGHPNVVRYFLKEIRGDFVYLALELCDLSLHDLIATLRSHVGVSEKINTTIPESTKMILKQIASGVKHIHSLFIVHRDLKPANILLAFSGRLKQNAKEQGADQIYSSFLNGAYVAKISDMGLGKQLSGQSSFGLSTLADSSLRGQSKNGGTGMVGIGPGSVGWQAPEVMATRWTPDPSGRSQDCSGQSAASVEASPADSNQSSRTSRSVDIFSLGCIFYSTLVPGRHPFGEWFEREVNVIQNKPKIDVLAEMSPDAYDLIKSMIDRSPRSRPTAAQVCNHPFFWTPENRLVFLCDLSDRLESNAGPSPNDSSSATGPESQLMEQVLVFERNAADVVGTAWDKVLDGALINNVQRYRSYDPSSVRDLLRLIRNKRHHFEELPIDFRNKIGSSEVGLLGYFEGIFPNLLMHCFRSCREVISTDDPLSIKFSIPGNKQRKRRFDASPREISTLTEVPKESAADDTDDNSECVGVSNEAISSEPKLFSDATRETHSDIDELDIEPSSPMKEEPRRPLSPGEGAIAEKAEETTITEQSTETLSAAQPLSPTSVAGIVVWEGSAAARALQCRGWNRSDSEWTQRADSSLRTKQQSVSLRNAEDPKFRTRLCNHWDQSLGTFCPMRRKNKCVFAHGPAELRVKEGKRGRWGKLVDKNGNSSNPRHSGGEDTYGAAKSIESVRKVEGKWNTNKKSSQNKKQTGPRNKRPLQNKE